MPSEKKLYPVVAKFATEKLGCIETKINTGTRFAHIDVLGLRQRASDFASFSELVAIEVKDGGTRILNYLGQALSYSLYAHKVYLAWRKNGEITEEEKEVSAKFGVGLLQIFNSNSVKLISTSREFAPERHYVLHALDKLKYFECIVCRANYPKEAVVSINKPGPINLNEDSQYKGNFDKAIKFGNPARYFLYQLAEMREEKRQCIYDKRFICKGCCSIFSALLPN